MKRNDTTRAAESAREASIADPSKVVGTIEVTRVVRDHIPLLQGGEYDPTIGQQVDMMLLEEARSGNEVQSFSLEFERDRWHRLAAAFMRSEA